MPFAEEYGAFTKTPCYHHVHVPCFAAYTKAELEAAHARADEQRRDGVRGMGYMWTPARILATLPIVQRARHTDGKLRSKSPDEQSAVST
jgi:hypothetical protein